MFGAYVSTPYSKRVEECIAKVSKLDLDSVRLKGMSHEDAEVAVGEYKKFLTLKLLRGDLVVPPPPAIDEVWHAHILDTAKYAADCRDVFGYFVHHTPDESYSHYATQTAVLYESVYGCPPPEPVYPKQGFGGFAGSTPFIPFDGAAVEVLAAGVFGMWKWVRGTAKARAFGFTKREWTVHLDDGREVHKDVPVWAMRPTLDPLSNPYVMVNKGDCGRWVVARLLGEQDGKYAVEYQDGEKEAGILSRAIRVAEPRGALSEEPLLKVLKGTKITANSNNEGTWHPGTVDAVDSKGLVSVVYDYHKYQGRTAEHSIPRTHVRRASAYVGAVRL